MKVTYGEQPTVDVFADGEKVGELWLYEGEGWTAGGWMGSPQLTTWLLGQGVCRDDVAGIATASPRLETLCARVGNAVQPIGREGADLKGADLKAAA